MKKRVSVWSRSRHPRNRRTERLFCFPMLCALALFALVVLVLPALAQTKKPTPQSETDALGRGRAIRKCKTAGHDDNECLRYLSREKKAHVAHCTDPDATVACHSFQELLAAKDADLMDDFATRTDVYVCFRPKEDAFFELWFNTPGEGAWMEGGHDSGVFTQSKGAELALYEGGIYDEDQSVDVVGEWSSFGKEPGYATFEGCHNGRARCQSEEDQGKGKIYVNQTHIIVSDSFKNKTGEETNHTFTVQRSTGRFTETYEFKIGKAQQIKYSGRCLIL